MRNVILPAQVLAAAQLCQAKNEVRYYLNGIYIDSKSIAGTNGHILFRNDYADRLENYHQNHFEPGIIEKPVIINMDSAVPKAAWTASLNSIDATKGYIEYRKATMDICGRAFFDVIDGKYPDIDRVMPKTDPVPVANIDLNQEYVALTGKVLAKFYRFAGARMTFYGENSSVKVSRQTAEHGEVIMLIMPCRL